MQTGSNVLGLACDLHAAAEQLNSVLEGRNLEPSQLLFDVGDPADDFCIVRSGSLRGEVGCPRLQSNILLSSHCLVIGA